MAKRNKPVARAEEQQAPPGPSPAWQKMKAAPKRPKTQRVHRVDAGPGHPSWRHNVVPGKCTCGNEIFEDNGVEGIGYDGDGKLVVHRRPPDPEGIKMNPWVFGHAYWCSMFIPKCEHCGMSSGTHSRDCQFWVLHPNLSPF